MYCLVQIVRTVPVRYHRGSNRAQRRAMIDNGRDRRPHHSSYSSSPALNHPPSPVKEELSYIIIMFPQGINNNISTLVLLVVLLGNSATLGFCGWGCGRTRPTKNSQRCISLLQRRLENGNNGSNNDDDDDNNKSSQRSDEEILKQFTERLGGSNQFPFPLTPRGGGGSGGSGDEINPNGGIFGRPSKLDLYDEAELGNLLDIHRQISSQTQAKQRRNKDSNPPESLIPTSLHDLVVQATQDGTSTADATKVTSSSTKSLNTSHQGDTTTTTTTTDPCYPWVTDEIRQKCIRISSIASDVDGTLLGSNQSMHPRTKEAIRKAVEKSSVMSSSNNNIDDSHNNNNNDNNKKTLKYFFPATGKTRWGALNSLGTETAALLSNCPGVFIQGLYVLDENQNIIFEKKLSPLAVKATEVLVREYNVSIVAYDGDDLYSTDLTENVVDLHEIYGEPMSQKINAVIDHQPGVHKLLVMSYDIDKLKKLRPLLEGMAEENDACVTQAIPSMLEILPMGCSKANGVSKLCEALGIDPSTELLALGDAENDVGMLQMAAIGVAVGNGCNLAKEAADIVLDETNDEGGAGLAMEVLGGI